MIYLKNKGRSRVLISCMAVLLVFIFVLPQNKYSNSAVKASEGQRAGVQEKAAEENGTSSA